MRQVAGPNRAVFMVLQGFAWERLRDRDQDPKLIQDPTRFEQRFMAWQTVASGANGIFYWGLHTTPVSSPLWDDIAAVAAELTTLKEELAARSMALPLQLEYHDTGHSLDRGIEWIAKPSPSGVVLIAVNADPNPVEVTFRNVPKAAIAEVLFEARSHNLRAGSFRDRFRPFDVHIYRLH
jgi:hypothetical protein